MRPIIVFSLADSILNCLLNIWNVFLLSYKHAKMMTVTLIRVVMNNWIPKKYVWKPIITNILRIWTYNLVKLWIPLLRLSISDLIILPLDKVCQVVSNLVSLLLIYKLKTIQPSLIVLQHVTHSILLTHLKKSHSSWLFWLFWLYWLPYWSEQDDDKFSKHSIIEYKSLHLILYFERIVIFDRFF